MPCYGKRRNIRVLNSNLAFTSTGAKVDHTVTGTQGPFTYRIHGQNYHSIGSLLPEDGKEPSFLQLYIFDTANEIQNRMQRMTGSGKGKPTAEEIAGLVVGDYSTPTAGRDVILQFKSSELQRISDLHPLYMSLQYPLLFPYGEPGYHAEIPYHSTEESQVKRSYMTMREYYAYQIQTRLSEGMTIIKGGRLLHQYIVDAYTATEQERLRFIALNQKKLRADLYNNVYDAVERGETDAKRIGKRIILPSSFTAGPRYMVEKYHDAMAICRWFGNPDLFITFTADPNWPEFAEHLQTYTTEGSNSRPDLQSRVFKMKLEEMLGEFNKGVYFPVPVAVVYTIEFQKRGLPHAHILLWLEGSSKNPEPAVIDKFISAELPDKETDPEGFQLVQQHMMHGPCGLDRPGSPCMENGQCSKKYPRAFVENTTIDKSGYVVYRRRNDESKSVFKGVSRLDNRHVVPHNLDLDCRYVSACEGVWRIFAFHIHYHKPAVTRLQIHLQDQQRLLFDQLQRLDNVLSREDVEKTMLTEWMATNKREKEAPDLAEDVQHNKRKAFDFTGLELTDTELEQYALIEIEQLLMEHEKSLIDFQDMPLPDKAILKRISHNLITEDLNYKR